MTALEFAKLIANGKDFEIKSFRFGECRLLNGVEYIVLYRDSVIPAVEIARWEKKPFWHYLDFVVNPSRRGIMSSKEILDIDNERSIIEKIYSYIGVEKGDTGDAVVDREQFVAIDRILEFYSEKERLANKISAIQALMNKKIEQSFFETFGFTKTADIYIYGRVLYMHPNDKNDVSWDIVDFCDWTIYFYYNSSENNGKKYKIPQKDIKDWFRDLNIEKMEVQNETNS